MFAHLRSFLFENRSTRQTVAKNVFWLSVSQLGSRLIRASVIIYAARVLGAGEFGVFSYALALAGFFTIFADVGLTLILTREVSKRPEEEGGRYFATVFWMKAALLTLTALAVIFVAPHLSKIEAATPLIPLIAILAIADGLREFSNSFFRAKQKMELEALVTTVMNVTIAVAGFVVLAYIATAHALTISYVTSAAAGALLATLILRREFVQVFRRFDRSLIRPVLRAALPIALLALLGSFLLNIDLVMLGWWRSAEEIGYYSAAQKVVQVLYTIPAIVVSSVFPVLSRLIGRREVGKERILTEHAASGTLLLAIPLAVGGIALAHPIIALLYGAGYQPATLVFQLLILTVLAIFPGTFFGNFIVAHDEQKKLAPIVLATSLLNVTLNVLLIPPFGIVGAAVATLGSQFFYNGAVWRLSRRLLTFRVLPFLKKIAIAALGMGALVLGLNALGTPVLLTIAVAGGAYLGTLILWKEPVVVDLISAVAKHRTADET